MNRGVLMKRGFTIFTIAAMLSCGIYQTSITCLAKEVEGSAGVSVSYVKEKNATFLLYVSINGNGALYDGESMLRKQVNKYELEMNTEKTFRIVPDKGNALARVLLNGKDITKQVKNHSITIYGTSFDQKLEVYFTAIHHDQEQNEKPNQPYDKQKESVKTSDTAKTGLSIVALMASLLGIIILKKKRKIADEE